MTDAAKRLEAAIRDLDSHLRDVRDLDPESRQLLEDAVAGIQSKLRAPGSTSAAPQDSDWSSRLNSAMAGLEANHPGLATMVTRVCDFLDQAGI
jgi:hypothetical protein